LQHLAVPFTLPQQATHMQMLMEHLMQLLLYQVSCVALQYAFNPFHHTPQQLKLSAWRQEQHVLAVHLNFDYV
jgi:uncharacterized membrane protein